MTQGHAGQLGTHLAVTGSAEVFSLQTGGGGLILGREPDGSALSVSVFRPEPTVVAAIAGLSFAQLICFRALALGADVRIRTSRPDGWQTFVNVAAGSSGSIRMVGRVTDVPAGSPHAPLLLVVDAETSPDAETYSAATWSTVLTVHDQLTQWNSGSLSDADLVLVQALSLAEARLVGAALGLSDAERSLATLPDGTATVISRSGARTARVVQTDIERWLIGQLDRGATGQLEAPRAGSVDQ